MTLAARSVFDLSLEESFLVWAMRHAPAWCVGRKTSHNEFVSFFGADTAEQGRAACRLLAEGVERRRGELGACAATELTALEGALLAVVAAIHARSGILPDALQRQEDAAQQDERLKVLIGCYRFADASERAGRSNDGRAVGRRYAFGHASELSPSISTTLIAGMRVWVATHKSEEDPMPELRRLDSGAISDDVWRAMDAVLVNTCIAARRPVQINCPGCQSISADESGFLKAISALQRHDLATGLTFLCDWQQPSAARQSLPAMQAIARKLLLAGHVIPSDPVAVQSPMPQAPLSSKALH